MKAILIDATLYYYNILKSSYGIRARNYLEKNRGLFRHTIDKYSLGTSINKYGLYNHLIKCGYAHDDILETRLVKIEETEFKFRDHFYGCVIFPIFYKGIPAHMTSRHLEDNLEATTGNEGMRHRHLSGKMDYLYNGDLLNSATNYIVMTEAPIDALTLLQQGLPAISSFGSLKQTNIKFFKDHHKIVILFDNDEDKSKGLGSALNAAKLLYKRKGIVAKIGTLPIVGDVNELWMEGKKDFKERILGTIEESKLYSSFDHYEAVRKAIAKREQRKTRNLKHTELFRKAKAIPILEVVKDYIDVLDMGGTFKATCPFHADGKTKSLFIYPETNTFYCFGSSCNKFGDTLEFVKSIEGITFTDALVKLNRR